MRNFFTENNKCSYDIKKIEIAKCFFYHTGLGISLVRNGSVLNKGYGHARLDPPVAFDENTVSNIGSTGKAFTAALLGILITESKQRGERYNL